jgi:hypothetical protein
VATPGPLAVQWGTLTLGLAPRAGAIFRARVTLDNAGTAAWRSRGPVEGVRLSYHWLDELGNPIVWDGIRTELGEPIPPGAHAEVEFLLRAPIPPGRYRLALDLVDEGRAWFAELGSAPLELEVAVRGRLERRGLAVRGADAGALAAQEEPVVAEADAGAVAHLAPGVVPAPDWSRRVLDAHDEGYAAVGGSVSVPRRLLGGRRAAQALAPWAPGPGRVPGFAHPLLCPSLVAGFEAPLREVEGLPALDPPPGEPWLYDGRIRFTARPRSGRRRG